MITLTPRPCQTLMRMIEGIAHIGSLIQRWGGMPTVLSSSLSSPPWGA